jgi:uncharacterized membrane protein YagU involved in acid resistance
MSEKIKQSLIGGIVGTIAMSIITWMAPLMGFPKMSPPDMLAGMFGLPVFAGWVMHFMIGIIFALAYIFLIQKYLRKIPNRYVKGAVFGIIVFVFAQIMMSIMGAVFTPVPSPAGSMVLIVSGSLIGHIVYGIVVVLFSKD